MPAYIALIRHEDGTDYWVDIPDIPGCIAGGETLADAMRNFEEALAFHLEAVDPASLPAPRPLASVLESETNSYIEAYAVELDFAAARRLKLSFSRIA